MTPHPYGLRFPHNGEMVFYAVRVSRLFISSLAACPGGVDIREELLDERLDGLALQVKPAFEVLFERRFVRPWNPLPPEPRMQPHHAVP